MASATLLSVDEYLRTSYELLEKLGLEAPSEITCRLTPTRSLIPDIGAAKQIADPYASEPLLLCVEILSPEDRFSATLATCEQYHDWGVPYCSIFNPETHIGWEYHTSGELEKRTAFDLIPMQAVMAKI